MNDAVGNLQPLLQTVSGAISACVPLDATIARRTMGSSQQFGIRSKERARLLNEQRTAEAAKRRAEDLANRARHLDQRVRSTQT